jgi:hypothetical protein
MRSMIQLMSTPGAIVVSFPRRSCVTPRFARTRPPLPEAARDLRWQSVAKLASDHHDLPTVVTLVCHVVG